jgi:hypothetical protein
MAGNSNDLNARLKAAAEGKVDRKALRSSYGIDCFALVDALLRSIGANSAQDYNDEVRVTATADYKWGDGIFLDSIRPGDILQFRKHVVEIWTHVQLADGSWFEEAYRALNRPHHTGIVVDLRKDGGVVIVEQNVRPNPKKITRNLVPRLATGEITRRERGKDGKERRIKIKVSGSVSAYRPAPKAGKGASLLLPAKGARSASGGVLARSSVVPAHGGAKRRQTPIGIG